MSCSFNLCKLGIKLAFRGMCIPCDDPISPLLRAFLQKRHASPIRLANLYAHLYLPIHKTKDIKCKTKVKKVMCCRGKQTSFTTPESMSSENVPNTLLSFTHSSLWCLQSPNKYSTEVRREGTCIKEGWCKRFGGALWNVQMIPQLLLLINKGCDPLTVSLVQAPIAL